MWGDFTNSSRLILKLQQLRICGAGLKTNKNTHGYSREDPHRQFFVFKNVKVFHKVYSVYLRILKHPKNRCIINF